MSHILTLVCPNRPGIVAAISGAIFAEQGNIAAAHQYDDEETGRFFGRVRVTFPGEDRADALRHRLAPIAAELGMALTLRPRAHRRACCCLRRSSITASSICSTVSALANWRCR